MPLSLPLKSESLLPSAALLVLRAIGAGLLFAGCFPPYGMPVLLPVAVATLLLLLRDRPVRHSAYLGFAAGLVFYGVDLVWLKDLFGAAAVSLWAIAAAYVALFCVLFVWIGARLPGLPRWLLAAILWAGIEYLRSEPAPLNFGWMGLGYAVAGRPWASLPAAALGTYGISFLIVALGARAAERWSEWRRTRRFTALTPLTCAGLAWTAALYVPGPHPPSGRQIHVRLVQANSEDEEALFGGSGLPKPLAGSTNKMRRIGRIVPISLIRPIRPINPNPQHQLPTTSHQPQAAVLLWPEYSFVSDPTRQPQLWARLVAVAQQTGSYFLFGAKDEFDPAAPNGFRNTVYVLDPAGRLIGRHVKNHTVHLVQDGAAGTDATVVQTRAGRLGVGTCFDMDYPDVARRLTQGGAQVLLVPSDNPAEWGVLEHLQHPQLFQMRAVECGRWIATTDVAGSTYAVDPLGRITQRVHSGDPQALDVTLGLLDGPTVYTLGGWRFGLGCLIASVALSACALEKEALRHRQWARLR